MALGTLSEGKSEVLKINKTKTKIMKPTSMRVRFLDEETITERFISSSEVDNVSSAVKKVHILKNRSSSETSLLLRSQSFVKHRTTNDVHMKNNVNLNNNSMKENLNGKETKEETKQESECKQTDDTKDEEIQNFKRNCNVYSVHQAKTLVSERRKSLPLAHIPKLIGPRADNPRQSVIPADVDCLDGSVVNNKDFKSRTIGKLSKGLGKLLRRSNSVKISEPDPVYKVSYLGNVLTGWARGENCIEKPLATLWRNYSQSNKPDVIMKLSITNSGLKGFTKEHGLTEYWSHRVTYCASPPHYPKIFCWVYRHEGRKLKHELRCHAVLCSKELVAKKITDELRLKLRQALAEFKKDRISKQNARMSLANSVYENPSMPRRKILLSTGAYNYRPPLERSKSAPKLGAIEELCSEEDEEEAEMQSKHTFSNTWSRNSTSDSDSACETYTSHSLSRRKSGRKSPKKTNKESRMQLKNSEMSLTDEVLSLLAKESKKEDEKDKTSHVDIHPSRLDDQFSNLECIYENNEVNESQPLVTDQKILNPQTNFVIDSDDGSVSSGCETASTVTSSDAEPSSLPLHFPSEDFPQIKECEDEDVFENSKHNNEYLKENIFCSARSDHELSLDEVNHVPIGEKNSFRRRSTYPPLKNSIEEYESNFDSINGFGSITSSHDTFKNGGDNDSACSDESGYSELLEGKESQVANTIMV